MDEELLNQSNGEESTNEEPIAEVLPEETKWKQIRSCCGAPVILVFPNDRLFCKHWEVKVGMPIAVSVIVLYCLLVYWTLIFPRLPLFIEKVVSSVEISVLLIMFIWSYIATMLMDPGFLPYTWHLSKKTKYSWEEQLTGLANREEQIEYAKQHKPPFASFSSEAGRYVIRADHICGWVCNWIGKRNHKQFMLMSLYGCLLALSFLIWGLVIMLGVKIYEVLYFPIVLSFMIEIFMGSLLANAFYHTSVNLSYGQTDIMLYKKEKPQNNDSCCLNWKRVCGYKSILSWICPTPAFNEITDIEIPNDV